MCGLITPSAVFDTEANVAIDGNITSFHTVLYLFLGSLLLYRMGSEYKITALYKHLVDAFIFMYILWVKTINHVTLAFMTL